MRWWPIILLLTYLPVTPSVLPGQHLPLPHAIHYTTDDGLPSTEVYCVLEDRRGYMWFGTDNGVVRFDGYSFKTYGPQQGLRDPVVFSLQEDKDGLIYACSGFSSKVFVWSSHTDLFSPHMVNIDSSLANAYPDLITKLVSVGSEDSLLFSTSHYGPLTYTPQKGVHYSSEILQLPDSISLHDRISVFAQNPTNLVTFFRTKRSLNDTVVNKWYDLDVPTDMYFFDTKGSILHRQRLPKLRSKSSYALFSFLHLANEDSTYVTVHKNKDIILESEQFSRKLPVPSSYFHPNFHFRLPDGDFLLGGSQGNGLVYYQNLEDFTNGRGLKILDNCNASFATLDHKGGLWVTTLDKGVFYYPVRSIKVYNEKQLLPASKNISLIDLGGDSLILGYETNEICIIQIPPNDSLRIEDKLTASFQPGVFFIDAPRNAVYTKRTQIQLNTLTQPKLVRLGGYGNIRLRPYRQDTALAATFHGPGLYDLKNHRIIEATLPNGAKHPLRKKRANDYLIAPDGTHYVANKNGLFRYKAGGDLEPCNLKIPALRNHVMMIESLPDSSLLLATRGQGLIRYKKDSATIISHREGLASNMIRHIHQSDDHSIWVSTFSGISQVIFHDLSPAGTDSQPENPFSVRTFTTAHGLPTNEVHQITTNHDHVWLATSRGLTDFIIPQKDTAPIHPLIRQLVVNGQPRDFTQPVELTATENNLELNYITVDFRMRGDIEYRYRLRDEDAWINTKLRSVNLTAQPYGSYQFAVQSRNQDGFWSEATRLEFAIAPHFTERLIVRIAGILLLMGLLTFILYLRQRRINQRKQLKQQIQELERAALRAQMDPHFTFNCLNSINRFILKNDADQASLYLTKFAKLIRQTLNTSLGEEHSLKEELVMLENYLSLEKLRFKEKVNYRIEVDPSLETSVVRIPPLLIQPYVENALVHGLRETKQGGKIDIFVEPCPEGVKVRIVDNGVGYDPIPISGKTKSLGMRITQQRLSLLSANKDTSRVKIYSLNQPKNGQRGTSVEIVIATKNLAHQ